MERALNRVELRGNVGGDPKVSTFEEEDSVMRFSLATNESYKNRKGELIEETIWHNVVAWAGRNIPDFSKIKKGSYLYVLGRIKPVQYVTKTGIERQSYEILAFNIKVEDFSVE